MKRHFTVALGMALPFIVSIPLHADNHALIMGISDYKESPLYGVVKDLQSARQIAISMGVPEANITVKKEAELTLAGLRSSLSQFQEKIKPGDRAFIYFSGHGTSRSKGQGQCEESIVTQEIDFMPKAELHQYLTPIINNAAKTFVFLDTCFSGGVIKPVTRARGTVSTLKPKFMATKFSTGENDVCGIAVNYAKGLKRDFSDIEVAENTPNYFMLGSAGSSEYAIDGGSEIGGFATTSFLSCIKTPIKTDKDRDGVITLSEAKHCAQLKINDMISPPFLAQTLTEAGSPGSGAIPAAFVNREQPNNHTSEGAQQAVDLKIDSLQLLETIRNNSDQTHTVKIKSAKEFYKIKRDYLDLEILSDKSGYLTLFSVGSSGRIFQLFPNNLDNDNKINANEAVKIPRMAWRIPSGGPAGNNRFLAVVSGLPDQFDNLGIPVGKRFKAMEANALNAKEIMQRLINPAPGCVLQNERRDFSDVEVNPCSSGYGAGIIDVKEVD